MAAALLALIFLSQRTESFSLSLDAAVADALPLFGPVREAEWSSGWAPQFVDGGRCRATVAYRRSALDAAANHIVDALDAHWAAAQGPHWAAAVNGALARSRQRQHADR
jgi:hypothetical protein